MRTIVILTGILMLGLTSVQSLAQKPETPLQVSLCEVKAHPEKYLHKLVEFTATASHGFEDSMVEDSNCSWSEHHPGVWMEYGGKRSTSTKYCCGFSPKSDRDEILTVEGIPVDLVDNETFRTFDMRLHVKPTKRHPSNTVRATMRGRIFAKYEGIMGTQVNPDWRGYGHMGCCMLFAVTQVVSLDPPNL